MPNQETTVKVFADASSEIKMSDSGRLEGWSAVSLATVWNIEDILNKRPGKDGLCHTHRFREDWGQAME